MVSQPPVEPPVMVRAHLLVDGAERLVDRRHQLLGDGIPVGPEVRRVHRVGVVEVGVLVADLDGDDPRRVLGETQHCENALLAVLHEAERVAAGEVGLPPDHRVVAGAGCLE